jgi:selenide,water dikinase
MTSGLPGASALLGGDVLVGVETSDDAGVVRLRDDLAIVTTADFITPPFDDPALYGAIAAANALSDVYAMGGQPVCAINLCAFPKALGNDVAREILGGALAKVTEAGAATVGGHTVLSPELFFGLAVTGQVHPDRVWRNRGLRPGDRLLLTKPLGTGFLVGAARAGQLAAAALERVGRVMATLNRDAARVLAAFGPSAVTDVTGFGLAGHALGMARASRVILRVELDALPMHAEVPALIAAGVTCRGERENREATRGEVQVAPGRASDPRLALALDTQTAGGLLAGIAEQHAEACLQALRSAGVEAAMVGAVTEITPGNAETGAPALLLT